MIEAANDPCFAATFEAANGLLWDAREMLVRRGTYPQTYTRQIYPGSMAMQLPEDEQPVYMLGCLHCRVYFRNGPRGYLWSIALRYIRRSKITIVDPAAWWDWLDERLLPLIRAESRRGIYCQQRSIEKDLRDMVTTNRAVLEGKGTGYLDDQEMRMLRMLHRTARRVAS